MLRFQEAGDLAAFQTLFERHKEALLAFLQRLSGRLELAEDVSQQAWLKLLEVARRGEYRATESASFRTFLFTLARNHFVDKHVRAHAVTKVHSLKDVHAESLAATGEPPEELASAHQVGAAVDRALRELPHEQREVAALWSVGFDVDTIAAMVAAPRDTVISRKKYALAKLRQALQRQGIEET